MKPLNNVDVDPASLKLKKKVTVTSFRGLSLNKGIFSHLTLPVQKKKLQFKAQRFAAFATYLGMKSLIFSFFIYIFIFSGLLKEGQEC